MLHSNEELKLPEIPNFSNTIISQSNDKIEIANDDQFNRVQSLLSIYYNQHK